MKDQAVIDGTTVRIDPVLISKESITGILESFEIKMSKNKKPATGLMCLMHSYAMEYGRDILGVDTGLMQPARRIL